MHLTDVLSELDNSEYERLHNIVVKPFIFRIIQFTEHICKMHELAKYLTPPSTKGKEYDEAD